MTGQRSSPNLHGGQIHITIVTPDKVDEAAKVIRVHEIHNETLCSVTSYLDGSPVGQGGEGGNEGQHPYDTSPHAQEHQNEARSSAIGGTIVIEIHNETRLIENRYFTSRAKAAEGVAVPEGGAEKRKQPSTVKVKKGSATKTTAAAAPKKARLAIEAAKPASASSVAAAARQARQSRRSAGATSGEDSVVGGL